RAHSIASATSASEQRGRDVLERRRAGPGAEGRAVPRGGLAPRLEAALELGVVRGARRAVERDRTARAALGVDPPDRARGRRDELLGREDLRARERAAAAREREQPRGLEVEAVADRDHAPRVAEARGLGR